MDIIDQTTGKIYELREQLFCELHKANCAYFDIEFKVGKVYAIYKCIPGYHNFMIQLKEKQK